MSQSNKQHIQMNDKFASTRASNRSANTQYTNYTALDIFRREMMQKEEETNRLWREKYDPWLINEYQQLYQNASKARHKPPMNQAISLQRPEWQQPVDSLPPLSKRLPGQRRRRLLGAFPQTESDKIGWRVLPEQAIDIYGSQLATIPPLPKQYKLSSWPVESFS